MKAINDKVISMLKLAAAKLYQEGGAYAPWAGRDRSMNKKGAVHRVWWRHPERGLIRIIGENPAGAKLARRTIKAGRL